MFSSDSESLASTSQSFPTQKGIAGLVGQQETSGIPVSWSQQVIHELSGLDYNQNISTTNATDVRE
jgi:hypothetical protein